jgi:hypothetical protein
MHRAAVQHSCAEILRWCNARSNHSCFEGPRDLSCIAASSARKQGSAAPQTSVCNCRTRLTAPYLLFQSVARFFGGFWDTFLKLVGIGESLHGPGCPDGGDGRREESSVQSVSRGSSPAPSLAGPGSSSSA